ncbi:GpE family phage tail protein [Escherichia coli]|nr:GpE family phage tail protein [Escherichia coli]EKL9721967.1 GpE family phage tail protein [Escherichia coli]MBC0405255.1 GpE family phage tail protein [Escherichia coli]HBE6678090.1 GpE family phage tail protein [Escherichia coli]
MADIATIFHWPPSVTDVMPLVSVVPAMVLPIPNPSS